MLGRKQTALKPTARNNCCLSSSDAAPADFLAAGCLRGAFPPVDSRRHEEKLSKRLEEQLSSYSSPCYEGKDAPEEDDDHLTRCKK